jgi:carbon storage regulator
MLVLTRKKGESLVIQESIRVRVVGISGGQVRLGIEAPANVRVLRGELILTTDSPPQTTRRKRPRVIRKRHCLP